MSCLSESRWGSTSRNSRGLISSCKCQIKVLCFPKQYLNLRAKAKVLWKGEELLQKEARGIKDPANSEVPWKCSWNPFHNWPGFLGGFFIIFIQGLVIATCATWPLSFGFWKCHSMISNSLKCLLSPKSAPSCIVTRPSPRCRNYPNHTVHLFYGLLTKIIS